MTQKEFIDKFNLTKTKTKAWFNDGVKGERSRVLYTNNHGKLFVFYGNDLNSFIPYQHNPYEEGMQDIEGRLGAGYSWYH